MRLLSRFMRRRKLALSRLVLAAGIVIPSLLVAQDTSTQTSAPAVKDKDALDKAWSILATALSDKSVEKRTSAVKVLGLIENNTRATDLALNALNDEHPEVRAAAAEALGEMKAKSAAGRLKELVDQEKDVSAVIAAARALINLDDPAGYNVYYTVLTGERKSGGGMLDEQKKLLHDPKKMAEFGFEQGIGFIPFAGVGVGALRALTKDDSSPVRAAAAKVLARDPDPDSGKALVAATYDKSWLVRAAALDAIADRNDPKLAPEILNSFDDEKDAVRYAAAATWIHLQEPGSKPARGKHKAKKPAGKKS
jgi:HEAT repeat protein